MEPVRLFAYATATVQAFLVLTLFSRLILRRDLPLFDKVFRRFNWGMAALVALAATSGSLYLSEVLGYLPCKLCWYQRIAMYPQVLLLVLGWWKEERSVRPYAILMSLIGAGISAYHIYIQKTSAGGICNLTGPSCETKYIGELGYITIPVMAFTAFLTILVLLTLYDRRK